MTALKTRPPTGRVPWPLILVEGAEKAGKSWACAELSASNRVGQTYWIDLGEGSADEYGAIPGARYLVVEHDGTFAAILSAVEQIKALAAKAAAAGEPPVVLVVDSMTAEWDLLKGVADGRARQRLAKKGRRLAEDEEPQISMDLWNDVNGRHRKLMTHLMTFPGIACITARGKDVAALDGNGRPIEGSKEYKVDGQKNLAFDASVWIRVSRDHPPMVVGARSVHAGVKPGVDKPKSMPDLSLERVVFDVLKCQPVGAHVRDLIQPQVTAADLVDPAQEASPALASPDKVLASPEQRTELYNLLKRADLADPEAALRYINGVISPATVEGTKELTIAQAVQVIERVRSFIAQQTPPPAGEDLAEEAAFIRETLEEMADEFLATLPEPAAEPRMVTDAQHRNMHAIWNELGYAGDHNRDNRLKITGLILKREVDTSKSLTEDEAEGLISALESKRRALKAAAPAQAAPPQATRSTTGGPITGQQRTELLAGLTAAGIADDKDRALAVINEAIAPASVTTIKALTEFQAAQVIGRLAAAVPA